MNTILAGRTFAQELVHELRQRLQTLLVVVTRADAGDDESSTRFSWPRGF